MQDRYARSLRNSVCTLLLVSVLCTAIGQADRLVPSAWFASPAGGPPLTATSQYIDPQTQSIFAITGELRFVRQRQPITTRIDMTCVFAEYPQGQMIDPRTGQPSTSRPTLTPSRDELHEMLKTQLRLMATAGAPEAVPLLDAAFAAPGTTVSRVYPERVLASRLMTARSWVMTLWVLAVAPLLLWSGVSLAKWLRARAARNPHCPFCGYDRTNDPGSRTPCPECGRRRPSTPD